MMDLLGLSRNIKKEHTHKYDEETAYERDCVDAPGVLKPEKRMAEAMIVAVVKKT